MPRRKSKPGVCRNCGQPASSPRASYCHLCRPRGKYKSRKTEADGQVFDSRGEAERWLELKQLERERKIINLRRGQTYGIYVGPKNAHVCCYTPDFEYINPETMGYVVEDFKGFRTPVYNLKKKLMKAAYDIEIFETGPAAKRKKRRKR